MYKIYLIIFLKILYWIQELNDIKGLFNFI